MRISTIWSIWAGVIATIALFFWLSLHNYLLFHTAIEIFSAVVAGCVFILTLTLVDTSLPAFFVIIGCGQGIVTVFTLLHMATYKGMGIIGAGDANLPTQLWIATRLVDTGALFVGVLMIGKTVGLRLVMGTFAAIAGVLLASLFIWPVFPDCFIEGMGLTPFKVAMEYAMIGVLTWSVWRLYSRRDFFSAAVLRRLRGAYVLNIVAGMTFTLYTDVYGLTNVLGHLTIFVSYLLIADALVRHMVREPQAIWFRDLYTSEVKFRSLTESSPDYIMRFDRQFRHTYVNPAGLKVAGRTADEMIGKTQKESGFAEDLCIFWQEKIQQVFDTAEPYCTEFEWDSPGGVVVLDWRLMPEFDADAQVVSVLSVSRDITERKQIDAAQRRSAEIKDVLREIAEAAVLAISMDELYATVHRLVERVLPVKVIYIALLDEAAGEIVVPYCVDETNAVPRQRRVGKGVTEYTMRMGRAMHVSPAEFDRLYASGEITQKVMHINDWLEAPLVDSRGVIFGVIALNSLEVTQSFQAEDVKVLSIIAAQVSMAIERKRTENELALLCQKLEEASHAKSRFIANMSHELRTPLNAIIGFSEVLKDKLFGPLNKKQDKYVENVLVSAQHLLSLITDILDMSKVEAGKMELERSRIDIKEICQDSVALFRDKATMRKVRLSFTADATIDGVSMFADGRRIKQILYNLIDNGIKYNKPGGSISVTVKKVNRGSNPSAIQIVVEDTGIGITCEGLAMLFLPFSQLSRTQTELTEGTGLGLALTKLLVELHGGEIYVESEFGKGSRFIVLIPMQEEQACS